MVCAGGAMGWPNTLEGTLGRPWGHSGLRMVAQGCWHSQNPPWGTGGLEWRGSGSTEITLLECQHVKCVLVLQPCHCLWLFFFCF